MSKEQKGFYCHCDGCGKQLHIYEAGVCPECDKCYCANCRCDCSKTAIEAEQADPEE